MDWNWEIFEHLAEFVYVADMDTHELLYMNHVINDVISAVCSLAGIAMLVIALWFQFRKKDSSGGPGNWPPMR